MSRAELALIVARAKNGVIGRHGTMPWHFSEDLKYFRKVTTGHAVIMGRRTFESIGKPLPNRRNILVTTTLASAPGCEVARSLSEALTRARTSDPCPIVIGGARLYAEALPHCTRLYITEIPKPYEGDTYFPEFNSSEWAESHRTEASTPEGELIFRVLERVPRTEAAR